MRNWKKAALTLFILVTVPVTACSLAGQAGNGQTAVASREDLTVTVSGTGSLATRQTARLSFNTAGKLDEINVEEGDEVARGARLATLETDSLALAEKSASVDLARARLAESDARMAVTEAELAYETAVEELKAAQNGGQALELAVLNAQISLDQARKILSGAIAAVDFDAVEAQLNRAQAWYDYAKSMLQEAAPDEIDDWLLKYESAQEALDAAKAEYDNSLAGYNSQDISIRKKQVEAAELALDSALNSRDSHAATVALKERAVDAAQAAIEQATRAAELAGQEVELAERSQALAEKNLADATLTAPFDGVVSGVEVEPGDAVDAGAVVVRLVTPTELELLLEIDEIDVARVRTGQEAIISVDAFPGEEFGGTVAAVYPVPAQVTGLVVYNVKLALGAPEGSDLKIGMRATADIVVARKNGVIVVPGQAVKEDGQGGYFVNVVSGKKVEQRAVTVGASDGTRTEITGGIAEGETVQS